MFWWNFVPLEREVKGKRETGREREVERETEVTDVPVGFDSLTRLMSRCI